MKQPDKNARQALNNINSDVATYMVIPNTKTKIRLKYLREYTIERLTEIWSEVDMTRTAKDAPETLKYAVKFTLKPYKEAALYYLNGYWKIRLFYRFLVWWWSKAKGYSIDQMNAIITEGKKKLTAILQSYYANMVLTLDTREDVMKMTSKEAEQYRAELISVVEQLSSKNTQNLEGPEDSSSDL